MLPGSEWGKGMIDVAVTKQRHGMGVREYDNGKLQWSHIEQYSVLHLA